MEITQVIYIKRSVEKYIQECALPFPAPFPSRNGTCLMRSVSYISSFCVLSDLQRVPYHALVVPSYKVLHIHGCNREQTHRKHHANSGLRPPSGLFGESRRRSEAESFIHLLQPSLTIQDGRGAGACLEKEREKTDIAVVWYRERLSWGREPFARYGISLSNTTLGERRPKVASVSNNDTYHR